MILPAAVVRLSPHPGLPAIGEHCGKLFLSHPNPDFSRYGSSAPLCRRCDLTRCILELIKAQYEAHLEDKTIPQFLELTLRKGNSCP